MQLLVFPLQKLLFMLLTADTLLALSYFSRALLFCLCAVLFILSHVYEGARLYTILFFPLPLLIYFQLLTATKILLFGIFFCLFFARFYKIAIYDKGPNEVGYKLCSHNGIDVGIYYPCVNEAKQHPKWVSRKYMRVLYEIFYVDPLQTRIPFPIFAYIMSFINLLTFPAQQDAAILAGQYPAVIFSHGLGSNLTNYSSLCCWWASHGHVVISVQHDHDNIMLDFRVASRHDLGLIERYLYQHRNKDLHIRANEFIQVYHHVDSIVQKALLEVTIGQVFFAGHSFGGATAIQSMAKLRKGTKVDTKVERVKGLICLDPWFFPLSSETYSEIVGTDMLVINSECFFKVVPSIYEMEEKMSRLHRGNEGGFKAVMIAKTDHLAPCDGAFVFGNLMRLTGSIKLQHLSKEILRLHQFIIAKYMLGIQLEEIIQTANKSALLERGVKVVRQYRYEKELGIKRS